MMLNDRGRKTGIFLLARFTRPLDCGSCRSTKEKLI